MFMYLFLFLIGSLVAISLYTLGMCLVVISKDNELPDFEDVIV